MENTITTLNYKTIAEDCSQWLKDYAVKAGAKGFVLGVSGGIDSAVVSTLCAMTGFDVLILKMPIHQELDQMLRADSHVEWLESNYSNIKKDEINLSEAYDILYDKYSESRFQISDEDFNFSMANTRSRLRMTTLYQFAGMHKFLVAGTGNKVEDFGIGFYTKYGDGGVDISPIADLMKSEVYALGRYLGINEDILNAAPTDGLHTDGRTDEDQIGATYDELEWAMKHRASVKPFNPIDDRKREVLRIYDKFHNSNKHKMEPIPTFETNEYRK